jgi:hypothetical protein
MQVLPASGHQSSHCTSTRKIIENLIFIKSKSRHGRPCYDPSTVVAFGSRTNDARPIRCAT